MYIARSFSSCMYTENCTYVCACLASQSRQKCPFWPINVLRALCQFWSRADFHHLSDLVCMCPVWECHALQEMGSERSHLSFIQSVHSQTEVFLSLSIFTSTARWQRGALFVLNCYCICTQMCYCPSGLLMIHCNHWHLLSDRWWDFDENTNCHQ
jgi:hypothetical protein